MFEKLVDGQRGRVLGLKACLTFVLALVLLVPLEMVRAVVSERGERAEAVADEIAGKWAYSQSIRGPFLVIPAERRDLASENGDMEYRTVVLLPDLFSADAEMDAEQRSRGIFDTVVYTSKIRLRGEFQAAALERAGFEGDAWRPRFDRAILALSISDLRGLQGDLSLLWNGITPEAQAEMPKGSKLPPNGVHWQLPAPSADGVNSFDLTLTLRGSARLSFVPVGKRNTLTLQSNWSSPSFDGLALPIEHEIRDDGFAARWDVSHLSRPLPQSWTSDGKVAVDWSALSIGASFLQPVNFYLLSERSVKYGVLFVALLFLTFFLFEVLVGVALHPLQYLMVGAGLVLFFLSLVAFAEVLGFAAAYGLSSALVAAMVSLYAAAILQRRLWAGLLCVMIVALYALLFVVLNLEEAALLAGTLVLFAALGLTMYVTRNVDWFGSMKDTTAPTSEEPGPTIPEPDRL